MIKQRKNAILAFGKKSARRSHSGRRLVVESLEPRTMMSAVPHFSQMVVFGDSLSDTGNLRGPLGQALLAVNPGFKPTNGRFTSDPTSSPPSAGTGVWHEVLADELGIAPATPSKPKLGTLPGTNFATGGADTGVGDGTLVGYLKNLAIPDVNTQLSSYLSGVSGVANSTALYSIWGGGNDLLERTMFGQGSLSPNVHAFENTAITAANHIENDIITLSQRGAKYFIWPNLPEIETTPRATIDHWSAATKAAMADAVQAFNNAWAADIRYIHAHYPTLTVYAFDVHTLFNEMLQGTYPGYRFSNTTVGAAFATPKPASADSFLFWDNIHPTEMAHRLLGEAAYNLIASSPSVNAYSVTPTATTLGASVQVHWTVSDPNGSGLNLVELWRAPDAGGVPGNWGSPLQWQYVSGTGQESGSFVAATSSGKWWYDVMVIDVNGVYSDAVPTEVTVHAPGASSAQHLMAATPDQPQVVSLAAVDAVMAAYGQK